MKAIAMSGVGGPEVLRPVELPMPTAGPDELVVRVKAAGVNPIDYKLRKTGAMGAGAGTVLGFDVAGIVEQVGPGVSDFKPGDAVYYSPDFSLPGAYAEFHLVHTRLVAPMPGNLSFEQAAALPLAGTTAWEAIFNRGGVMVGQRVLIAGANGGVGSLAVQMGRATGAFVYATCSTRSMDFVRSIPVAGPRGSNPGPDRVLNYQTEAWWDIIKAECPGGLDVVFDCAGQDVVSRAIPLMKPFGRIVTIVNPAGKLDEAYRRNVALHYSFLSRSRATLESLKTLAERGLLVPLIDRVMPLEEVAEAHRMLEAGGVKGKLVLTVS